MKPKIENPTPKPDESLRLFQTRTRRFAFQWHLHEQIELTLITHGSGKRFVGDAIDRYGAGDMVLLGSGLPHTWASDESSRNNQAVVAQFHPDVLNGWPELQPTRRLMQRASIGLVFDDLKLARKFTQLKDANPFDRWLSFLQLLHHMAQCPQQHVRPIASHYYNPPAGITDRKVHRLFAMLSVEFRHQLQQAHVAQTMGMSPQAFARFFRRLTGQTFTRYLQQLRITQTCQQLQETDKRITDIAFDCGFTNLSHFNRVFQKHIHCTPRDYQQQHRNQAT